MGQKVSMSPEQQNQLFNFLGAKPNAGADPQNLPPAAMIQMMASTVPLQQQRRLRQNPAIRKQRNAQPVARVQREPRR